MTTFLVVWAIVATLFAIGQTVRVDDFRRYIREETARLRAELESTKPRHVTCNLRDTLTIVDGEYRHTWPAVDIVDAFKPTNPGQMREIARHWLHYEGTLRDLHALVGTDAERALKKMRGHLAIYVVDARLALGLPPYEPSQTAALSDQVLEDHKDLIETKERQWRQTTD